MQRWAAIVATAGLALCTLTGCGEQVAPGRPDPGPPTVAPTPTPTVTTTSSPAPTNAGPPPGFQPRGIPALNEMGVAAARYADALKAHVDQAHPGHTHEATCQVVPMLWIPGASTRCTVTTDGVATEEWTALTTAGSGAAGNTIEFSVGRRTDLPPFPPEPSGT